MDRFNIGLLGVLVALLLLSNPVNAGTVFQTEYLNGSYITTKLGESGTRVTVSAAKASSASSRAVQLLSTGAKFTPAGALRTAATLALAEMLADIDWPDLDDWPSQVYPGTGTQGAIETTDGLMGCSFWQGKNTANTYFKGALASSIRELSGGMPSGWYHYNAGGDCWKDGVLVDIIYFDCFELGCEELSGEPDQRRPITPREFTDAITENAPGIGDDIINNIPDEVIEPMVDSPPSTDSGTSYEPHSSTGTSTSTTVGDTTTTTMEQQWPAFCEWASIVCNFIDWMQEPLTPPPEEDIPFEVIGQEQTYNAGLGTGSCPAPTPYTINGSTGYFSYQVACDAAGWVKYAFIAIASLIAGYILLGHKGAGA